MHLKMKGNDIFTGEQLKQIAVDQRNSITEPSASIFRKWRDVFKNHFCECKGIKSTDVIEIRFTRQESGLVDFSWAERREIGEALKFVTQDQLLKEARKKDCDVAGLLTRVKSVTQFDEQLSKYPHDGDGLIKHSRKAYLLNQLLPELRRLEVDEDALKWWENLPCSGVESSIATVETTPISTSGLQPSPIQQPPESREKTLVMRPPSSSLSNVAFQFLLDMAVPQPDITTEEQCDDRTTMEDGEHSECNTIHTVDEEADVEVVSLSKMFRNPHALAEQLSGQKRKRRESARVRSDE